MLTQICKYLRNWFDTRSDKTRLPYWTEEITIENGELVGFSDKLIVGQYFRVIDSLLNDGVYQYPATLKDEVFHGTIQSMAVPQEIIDLDAEISEWITANASAIASPYMSESWGGYSYSKGYTNSGSGGSATTTWEGQFADRLAPWRKI